MIVILLLGFSSGLPFALSFTTLSVWLAELGVRKADIGLFAMVSLPYALEVPVGAGDRQRAPARCSRGGSARGAAGRWWLRPG